MLNGLIWILKVAHSSPEYATQAHSKEIGKAASSEQGLEWEKVLD